MSILGPTITLDTVVETLVIGVGTLSGVHRLEMLSYFACLSVLVNYLIFMTFYPACLSLMLELTRVSNFYGEKQQIVLKNLLEENDKANPAVQRVKLIMSIGLSVVHIHSRWFFKSEATGDGLSSAIDNDSCSEDSSLYSYFFKQLSLSLDHVVILIVSLTLIVKFVFFENDDRLKQIQTSSQIETTELSKLLKRQDRLMDTVTMADKAGQTNDEEICSLIEYESDTRSRSLEECLQIYRTNSDALQLSDREVIMLVDTKHIPTYNLELAVKNPERGIRIRRKIIQNIIKNENAFLGLPYKHYDYTKVMGSCCENVIGYIQVPLGEAGPLRLDDKLYYVPMATTEGCLVASTNRGCKAVERMGIRSFVSADGMTRAPVVEFSSMIKATEVTTWLRKPHNFALIKAEFDSTSRFAKLSRISTKIVGKLLYLRFVAETGDAMGMNMLSKGSERALWFLKDTFPDMQIISLSGNYCTDKKPAAVNWIEGRGKSVVCETIIPADLVASTLKTNTAGLVNLYIKKCIIGSAVAGSMGGYNAQAANIVTAIYIATGQDPAQNVVSSNCITHMEACGDKNQDLYVSCTMPSVEVGTIGGGTVLPAQGAALDMLGIKGPNEGRPGDNSKQLARIVCATVLVGELSLMAAQVTGDLVKSHLKYNRSYSEKDGSISNLQPCCKK